MGRLVMLLSFSASLWLSDAIPAGFAQEAPRPTGDQALELGRPVERTISAGEIHPYRIALDTGQFLRVDVEQLAIDVVVTVVGPDGEQIAEVDGPTGSFGLETVELAAEETGDYRLEVRPWEDPDSKQAPSGRYKILLAVLLTAEQYAARQAEEQAKLDAVITWLSDHAIRLSTVVAGNGFEDMGSLETVVGDARIVALGEATHGTREFFQLKHRILEFLVSEMGFTVFAMEANMPEGFDVNEYVLTGEGDPERALAGLYMWTWNTEEVLDLIEWMRGYNADPIHERKVKFYGFDIQLAPRAARVTLDYLRAVDPEYAAAQDVLTRLANPYIGGRLWDWPEETKESAASAIQPVLQWFDDHRWKFIAATDSASFDLARQHAEILARVIERSSRAGPDANAFRDSIMAENVRWILDREGPDAKAILWAHNIHVLKEPPWMVGFLRDTFGSDLVAMGFAFNQGSFRALAREASPAPSESGVRPFAVEPAREGSLDWALTEAGLDLAAVDLRQLPHDGPVAEWWNEPHETRRNGGAYYGGPLGFPLIAPDAYDAILFVESTTTARPIPAGRVTAWTSQETPTNLDFEDGNAGGLPPGWITSPFFNAPFTHDPALQRSLGFEAVTTEDDFYRGERSGFLAGSPGRRYGEIFGTLAQRIDATSYRGKRVRLRAMVRSEVIGPGNEAFLWLQAARGFDAPQRIAYLDDMSDRPITHRDWREHEIVGEVPADAETIDFGLALVGEGRAWIDAVSLQSVEAE